MPETPPRPASLPMYLGMNAAALLLAGSLMILLAGSGVYSSLRLAAIGTSFLLATALVAAAVLLQIRPARQRALHDALLGADRARLIEPVLGLVFLVFWCLTWFPPQFTRAAYYYFIGLYPLILCGLLGSGSALVFLLKTRDALSLQRLKEYLGGRRPMLHVALISLTVFCVIAALTARLHLLSSSEPYWYGAGVPLLAGQIVIAVVIGVLAVRLEGSSRVQHLPLDVILFVLIWAVTAALWAATPVPESYWVTGPRPPNQAYYPFSDLITFDIGSQFALIGQGIFNHVFWDRALYMSFLVFLHTIGGQDYQTLMSIQAAIFAIFPALLYLIGRKLHSRAAGLVFAALACLRGVNSLSASAWIDTATFKHMLTDFPTAIALAIFVLLTLSWLESPQQRWPQAIWAGGVLGLTSLLRPHVLLLVPALVLLAAWVYRHRWRAGLTIGGLTLVAFLAGVAPWMMLGPGSGSIIAFYGQRVRDVISQRYPGLLPTPAPTGDPLWGPDSAATPGPRRPAPLPVPNRSNLAIPFVGAQFIHNLVTSGLIFPYTPELLSVKETVKGTEGFWLPHWDGNMSAIAAGALILNLALVALGMGAAFRRLGWRGLVPVIVVLIYHAANSLARTSGGRYLVPVDWIVVGYFAIGLTEVLRMAGAMAKDGWTSPAVAATVGSDAEPLRWTRVVSIVAQLAVIGALVPLAGVIYPRRYPVKTEFSLVVDSEPYLPTAGLDARQVTAFLAEPGAVILYGRALYPRFYPRYAGEPASYLAFTERDYPRTVFVLLGPQGYGQVLLPMGAPRPLPNASDAVVLGCRTPEEGYDFIDAVAVVLPQQATALARSPAAPLSCPLPEPVCDNNGNCY